MSALPFLDEDIAEETAPLPNYHFHTDYCQRLYEYWGSIRTNSLVPSRSDFKPRDVLDMLSHVLILELFDSKKAVFRLLGSAHDKRLGRNCSGKNFLDLVPERLRFARGNQFWTAGFRPSGVHIIRRNVSLEMAGQDYEMLLLPIRARLAGYPMQMIGVASPLEGSWRTASEQFLAHSDDRVAFIDLGAGVPQILPAFT